MLLQKARFPLFSGCVVFHCVNGPQLFYLFSYGWALAYFQIVAIVNNAATSTGVHMYVFLNWCFGILRIDSQKWDLWVKRQFHF